MSSLDIMPLFCGLEPETLFLYVFQSLQSGTTCVVTLLRGDQLHVAWLGDSQAVLVRDGAPVILMDPHKPEREVGTHKHAQLQKPWASCCVVFHIDVVFG